MDDFEDFENVTDKVTLEQMEDATYRTKTNAKNNKRTTQKIQRH